MADDNTPWDEKANAPGGPLKEGPTVVNFAAEKAKRISVEVLPKKLDEEVALEMVKGFGGVVTQLTKQQADYIGVTVEGPFKPDTYRY